MKPPRALEVMRRVCTDYSFRDQIEALLVLHGWQEDPTVRGYWNHPAIHIGILRYQRRWRCRSRSRWAR